MNDFDSNILRRTGFALSFSMYTTPPPFRSPEDSGFYRRNRTFWIREFIQVISIIIRKLCLQYSCKSRGVFSYNN